MPADAAVLRRRAEAQADLQHLSSSGSAMTAVIVLHLSHSLPRGTAHFRESCRSVESPSVYIRGHAVQGSVTKGISHAMHDGEDKLQT